MSELDVRWHPSAYAANAERYPHLDYTLLHENTHVQRSMHKSPKVVIQQGKA